MPYTAIDIFNIIIYIVISRYNNILLLLYWCLWYIYYILMYLVIYSMTGQCRPLNSTLPLVLPLAFDWCDVIWLRLLLLSSFSEIIITHYHHISVSSSILVYSHTYTHIPATHTYTHPHALYWPVRYNWSIERINLNYNDINFSLIINLILNMGSIEKYSNEEEFSTDPDAQITEKVLL
jgi:hypothetical protein